MSFHDLGRDVQTPRGVAYQKKYEIDVEFVRIHAKNLNESTKKLYKEQKNIERKREKSSSKKLPKCMKKYDESLFEVKEELEKIDSIINVNDDDDETGFKRRRQDKSASWNVPKNKNRKPLAETFTSSEVTECFRCVSKDNKIKDLEMQMKRNERNAKQNIMQLTQSLDSLQRDYEKLERKFQDEVCAKQDALQRLSKMASTKLRDNNPDITDLSDQNRPTKVAEKMSELYDNQWTDAFNVLEEELNEEAAVNTLLNTLMNAYKACKELSSRNFFERVQKAIELPKEAWNEKSDYKVVFTDQFKQEIKDFRKIRAPNVIHDLEKVVRPRLNLAKHQSQMVQEYVTFCVEIAWLCAVQDPPLVLDANVTERFNTNVFKDYTSRGDFVEFVVWPAMYLHKGGPILSKGVAQGRSGNQTPTSLYEKAARSVPAKARQREFSNQPCQVHDNPFSNQQRDQYHDSSRHHQSHQRTYQSNQQYINKSNTMYAMPRSTSDPSHSTPI